MRRSPNATDGYSSVKVCPLLVCIFLFHVYDDLGSRMQPGAPAAPVLMREKPVPSCPGWRFGLMWTPMLGGSS